MSLTKRKPRKVIRIREAATLIGCSAQSIRLGAVGNFTMFKLNPDKKTSPVMMFEAELYDYLQKREEGISRNKLTDALTRK